MFLWLLPTLGWAQSTLIEKYALGPLAYQHVFLDMVERFPSQTITTSGGQYVGQVDANGLLYGYGMFVNNDGSQIIGQFRGGKLLFGIKMMGKQVMVGSDEYYTSYSLETGYMEYIFRANEKRFMDGKGLYDYAFVSMRYQNGDQYVGEIYKRKRHGYGLYYYANGDIWFGEYNEDVRSGFGVLFDKDNHLTIGYWEGEDMRRQIRVMDAQSSGGRRKR